MANNILLNKTAAASSFVMPYAPSKIIDGTATPFNRWVCNTLPGWITIDAGAAFWVNRWVIKLMGNAGWASNYNMPAYTLQTSLDNNNWTTIDSVAANTANTTDRSFATISARYFRISVTSGIPVNPVLASIMDFEVYDAPAPNSLSALAVSSGSLSPAFNSAVFSYTDSVNYSTTSITVTPTAALANATITVNGTTVTSGQASTPINLKVGDNVIPVVVTANGTSLTYTIKVTRLDSTYLTALTAQSGSNAIALSPTPFAKTTLSYSATVGYEVSAITLTPTAESTTASITVKGVSTISGQASASIPLSIGQNSIAIVVTAGGVSQTYTITITRVDTGLSNLTGSLVPAGLFTLCPSFISTTFIYTASSSGKGSVRLTPTASNAGSVIKVNGVQVASGVSTTVTLAIGSNIMLITVANSGITTTYQITVNR